MDTFRQFFALSLLVLISVAAADNFECYTCYYDSSLPNLVEGDIACMAEPFNPEDIDAKAGYPKCYKAVAYDDNKNIESVHRGGGVAALVEFSNIVSREEDDFVISYCRGNLCNGAPSIVASLGILTSVLVILCSSFHKV